MREHNSFWISSGATCIEKITTHPRFLFNHTFNNNPVINIFTQLKELSPIINFYFLMFRIILIFLMSASPISNKCVSKLPEDNCDFYSIGEIFVLVDEVFFFQSFPAVTHNHLRVGVLNLFQTCVGRICHVLIWKNTVWTHCTHNGHEVLRGVEPLNCDAGPLR